MYIRDRDADIDAIEAEMGAIIFREGDTNVSIEAGKYVVELFVYWNVYCVLNHFEIHINFFLLFCCFFFV